MKNLFLAAGLLLALLFANDVKAQVIGKDIKTNNEFSLTYGTLSNSEWIEAFGEVVTVMFGGDTKTRNAFGPMSAEYFRRITPVVAVGAIGSVSSFREDMMKRTTTAAGETTSEKSETIPAPTSALCQPPSSTGCARSTLECTPRLRQA